MKKLLIAAALLTLPVMANAETKAQGSGPNPYTECGIGAAIFPDLHWAAATSNAIWDLGSTAITSALTTPETCNAKKTHTAKLILETLEGIEKDIAVGGGQYTTALADTMGCAAENRGAFVAQLRQDYGSIVSKEGYPAADKAQRAVDMYGSVKHAAGVAAQSCAADL